MSILFFDYETASRTDIKAGVYRYSEDPDFRVLMCAYALDDEPTRVAVGEEAVRAALQPYLQDEDVLLVAHNAMFERIVTSRLLGMPTGSYLPPQRWYDSMAVAAEVGRPKSLKALAKSVGAEDKDEAGTRLINTFCKPNRKGEWTTSTDKPDEWLAFIDYCRQDVDTLRDVWRRLPAVGMTPTERRVWLVDQRVNDNGIAVDLELARAAVESASDNRMVQELEISALTGVANPGSQPQLLGWLQSSGLKINNLQSATITSLLDRDDLEDEPRRVLELRQELALVAAKKYTAALTATSSDGRLRGGFRFYGAHTGRWTGSGVQLHNLPRASLENEAAVDAAILDLKMGLGADAHTLKALVRPLFTGPFAVSDYSAIEARVLAWLAGEDWALDAFRAGRDIYVETAERMGGLTRSQGKIAVLALGYAGGVNSLKAMGGQGSDEELMFLVQQWRAANARICRLWRSMDDAFGIAGHKVGPRLKVLHEGDDRVLLLPSGRSIIYRDVRWERYLVKDPVTGQMINKEGWRFSDPRLNGARGGTYGGRLVENATQAVARDVLAEALVRLHKEGHRVVGHVHDEILVEGNDLKAVEASMCTPPRWAEGLPIDAEGYVTERYRK